MKFILKIFLILFLVYYNFNISFSQTVKYRHYTVEDGLSSSEVYHVFQDSKGYIWFSTNYGVSRFDGYNFTNFSNNDGLPDNTVLETYEDPDGKIWFISMNCKLAYFYKNLIFTIPFNNDLKKYLKEAPYYVRGGFRVDKKGVVYMYVLNHGIFKIFPDHAIINDYADSIKFKPGAYLNVLENGKAEFVLNRIYNPAIKSDHKINVSWGNRHFDFLRPENKHTSALQYSIVTKQGKLLYSYSDRIMEISQNGEFVNYNYDKAIIAMNSDKNGSLWISIFKGGIKCYKNGDLNSSPKLHLFKNLSVSGFLRDREDGIWLTTIDKGVYYIPDDMLTSFTAMEGLSDDNVTSLVFDGKYINSLAGKINKICIDPASVITTGIPDKKYLVYQNLFYDPYRKKIWLSANFGFYSVAPNEKNMVFNQELLNLEKKAWAINDAIIGKDSICFSTMNHLIIQKNNKLKIYDKPVNSLLKIKSITSDEKGCIYVGSFDGLWKFRNYKFTYSGNINPLLKNRITVLKWNSALNALIIGTKGLGLLIVKDSTIFQIDKAKGISGSLVTSLQMNDCDIWAGTDNGLNKISFNKNDIRKYSITTISSRNGLLSNEVNCLYLFNDTIFVGTNGGITYFNIKSYIPNIIPPPVYITGLKVMQKDITPINDIELPYDKNEIAISFVGLSYRDAGNLEYKYKLEGTSGNWQTTRSTNIQYPKLTSGDYNFVVYASNENGVWSKTPAKIRFVIHPAFWQTIWFRLLFVLFIIAIITLIYLYRLRIIKEQNKLSQKANKYMLLSMGKQLNPHFIFNSLNAIQGFIFKNDKQSSNEYISEFALLMRRTLHNSQRDFISLADEIELLTSYIKLEAMRFDNKFTYEINVDPRLDIVNWKIPPFILQPYVENAIIHGLRHKDETGSFVLKLIYRDNHILCSLEDDGIGREKSGIINKENRKGHISMGSVITDRRINMINSLHDFNISMKYFDLQNENGRATGTRVEFVFPVIL